MRRRGFALVVVLWVLMIAAGLGLSSELGGRDGVDAARNRIAQISARFAAQGCAARVVAELAAAYSTDRDEPDPEVWASLDARLGMLRADATEGCTVQLAADGTRADINVLDEAALRAMFEALPSTQDAQRMAVSIVDWRAAHGRFRVPEELLLIPGLEQRLDLLDYLDTGVETIDILHAPEPVLRTLPGVSPSLARAILSRRDGGWRPSDLGAVGQLVPANAAAGFSAAFVEFSRSARIGPASWTLIATASAGRPAVSRSEEWTLARSPAGIAVPRRRVW